MARQISLLKTINKILDLMALADWRSPYHSYDKNGKSNKPPNWLPEDAGYSTGGMYGDLEKALTDITSREFLNEWCNIGSASQLDQETFDLILSRIPPLKIYSHKYWG